MNLAKITSKSQELIHKEDKLSTKVKIRFQSTKSNTYGDSRILEIKKWDLREDLRRDFWKFVSSHLDQYWGFEGFSKLVIYLVGLDFEK